MTLRKHQSDVAEILDEIVAGGSPVRNILAHVTPGGGKSTIPIQAAAKLIPTGLADRLCWIVPRASLQDQGERNFIDPFFRGLFRHNLTIRSSTNEVDPARGTAGFVTTYQALGVDRGKTVLSDFERHRYILVLDEFHHLEESGDWTEPIKELYRRAAYRVLMTGTMARGDEKKIAFLNYVQAGDRLVPCPIEAGEHAYISYTRADALADRAILPLEFHFADGVATWKKESGRQVTAKLSTDRHDANQALYTALKTEYAQELLTAGVKHWQNHQPDPIIVDRRSGSARRAAQQYNESHGSSLLVVAASIETAKEYTGILKRQGLHAEIATSDDTPQAVKAIKALKGGKLKALVSVAMAYEGLDCPSISHIICLTNVRSLPWIEQMIARAVRIDHKAGPYETQKGFIFAPADREFVELARKIEADQCEAIAIARAGKRSGDPVATETGNGTARPGITPLSSRLIPKGRFETLDLFGMTTGQHMGMVPGGAAEIAHEKTQREIETELRNEIDEHVRAWCRLYALLPPALNKKIIGRFGKRREAMTVRELEAVKRFLREEYPVPERKAPGIMLSPVRAWRHGDRAAS